MSHGLPPEIRLGHDLCRALAPMSKDAPAAVATHLRKFWDPRMRRTLVQLVRDGDDRIEPLLVSAVHDYLQGDIDRAEVAEPSGG